MKMSVVELDFAGERGGRTCFQLRLYVSKCTVSASPTLTKVLHLVIQACLSSGFGVAGTAIGFSLEGWCSLTLCYILHADGVGMFVASWLQVAYGRLLLTWTMDVSHASTYQ
jgi:hypothetical protein